MPAPSRYTSPAYGSIREAQRQRRQRQEFRALNDPDPLRRQNAASMSGVELPEQRAAEQFQQDEQRSMQAEARAFDKAQAAVEREQAASLKEQQREAARQQKAQSKQAFNEEKNRREAQYVAENRPTYIDADGMIQPKQSDEQWAGVKRSESAARKATDDLAVQKRGIDATEKAISEVDSQFTLRGRELRAAAAAMRRAAAQAKKELDPNADALEQEARAAQQAADDASLQELEWERNKLANKSLVTRAETLNAAGKARVKDVEEGRLPADTNLVHTPELPQPAPDAPGTVDTANERVIGADGQPLAPPAPGIGDLRSAEGAEMPTPTLEQQLQTHQADLDRFTAAQQAANKPLDDVVAKIQARGVTEPLIQLPDGTMGFAPGVTDEEKQMLRLAHQAVQKHAPALEAQSIEINARGAELQARAQEEAARFKAERDAELAQMRATPGMAPVADQLTKLDTDFESVVSKLDPQNSEEDAVALQAIQDRYVQEREAALKAGQENQQKMREALNAARLQVTEETKAEIEALASGPDYGSMTADASGADFYKDLQSRNQARLAEEGKKFGLTPEQTQNLVADLQKETEWTGIGVKDDPARVLSTGAVVVNPKLWIDPAKFKKAVDATNATPEAKARALEIMSELEKQALTAILPDIASAPGFREFALKNGADFLNPKVVNLAKWTPEEIEAARANSKFKTPDELVKAYRESPEGNRWWANHAHQAILGLASGTLGMAQQATGGYAAVTGNKDAAKLALDASRVMQQAGKASQAMTSGQWTQKVSQGGTSIIPALMGGLAVSSLGRVLMSGRMASMSAAELSALTSQLGISGSAGAAGLQSFGGTWTDAYEANLRRGMSHDEARAQALVPAIASGLTTAAVTYGFGATGTEAVFAQGQFRQTGKDLIRALAKGSGYEATEEALDQLMQGVIASLTYNPGKPIGETIAEALEAGAIGGVLGGGMTAVTNADAPLQNNASGDVEGSGDGSGPASTLPPDVNPLQETANLAGSDAEIARIKQTDPALAAQAETIREIASGTPLDQMTDAQLESVGVTRNPKGEVVNIKPKQGEPAPAVKIENGQPIITQPALDALEQTAPRTRSLVKMGEAEARQRISQQQTEQPSSPDAETPSAEVASEPRGSSTEAVAVPAERGAGLEAEGAAEASPAEAAPAIPAGATMEYAGRQFRKRSNGEWTITDGKYDLPPLVMNNELDAIYRQQNQPAPAASPTSTKSLDDVEIGDVDALIQQGGGQLSVTHQGRPVAFKDFAITIDDGEAEVYKVEVADKTASKGIGTLAYIKLGQALAERGITLVSSKAQYADGRKLWDRLMSQGYAVRTSSGAYAFQAKPPAATKSQPAQPIVPPERQVMEIAAPLVLRVQREAGKNKAAGLAGRAKLLSEVIKQTAKNFTGIRFVTTEPNSSPASLTEDGAMEMDVTAVLTAMTAKSIKDARAWLESMVDEEFKHRVALELERNSPEFAQDLAELYAALPDGVKEMSRAAYFAQIDEPGQKNQFPDEFNARHEFFRQYWQSAKLQKATEAALAQKGMLAKLRSLIAQFLRELRRIQKGAANPQVKAIADRLIAQAEAKAAELRGMEKPAVKDSSTTTQEKPIDPINGSSDRTIKPNSPLDLAQRAYVELTGGKGLSQTELQRLRVELEAGANPSDAAKAVREFFTQPIDWDKERAEFSAELAARDKEKAAKGNATSKPAPNDEISRRIASAEASGIVLSNADKAKIRAEAARAADLNKKAGRKSASASDPLNKGNAFPMGVGFTRVTRRANQRIDASVRRAGESVALSKQAKAAEEAVESLLAGKGTDADRQNKAARAEARQREVVSKLLNWKKGDKIGTFSIERVNKDRDGYPASYTFSGEGIIKGDDKIDVVRAMFNGDKAKFRRFVDEARATQSPNDTPQTPQEGSLSQQPEVSPVEKPVEAVGEVSQPVRAAVEPGGREVAGGGEQLSGEPIPRPEPAGDSYDADLAAAKSEVSRLESEKEPFTNAWLNADAKAKAAQSKYGYSDPRTEKLRAAVEKKWAALEKVDDKLRAARSKVEKLEERTQWDGAEAFNKTLWGFSEKWRAMENGPKKDAEKTRLLNLIDKEWESQIQQRGYNASDAADLRRNLSTLNSGPLFQPLAPKNQIARLAELAVRVHEEAKLREKANKEIEDMGLKDRFRFNIPRDAPTSEIERILGKAREQKKEEAQIAKAQQQGREKFFREQAESIRESGKEPVWTLAGKEWSMVSGELVTLKDVPWATTLFIHQSGKEWVVSEAQTGAAIGKGKTAKAAKEAASEKLLEAGQERFDRAIKAQAKIAPPKPTIPTSDVTRPTSTPRAESKESGIGTAPEPYTGPNADIINALSAHLADTEPTAEELAALEEFMAMDGPAKAPEPKKTSIKNAVVNEGRAARGLDPLPEPSRRGWDTVTEAADAQLKADPTAGQALLEELKQRPRPITDQENALLLLHKVITMNRWKAAAAEVNNSEPDSEANKQAKARYDTEADRYNEIDLYGKKAGTELGRGLNARKMLRDTEVSEEWLMQRWRAEVNLGEPLSEPQKAKVKKHAARIKRAQKAVDDLDDEAQAKLAERALQRLAADMAKAGAGKREGVRAFVKNKAKDARERIRAAMAGRSLSAPPAGNLSSPTPSNISDTDLATVGAELIADGATSASAFAEAMQKELGIDLGKDASRVFLAAKRQFDLDVAEFERANQPKALITAAKESDGEINLSLLTSLAKSYIRQGIKDAEELTAKITADLQALQPGITQSEVNRLLSGYGKTSQPSKDEIQRQLTEIKSQLRLLSGIEDVSAGKPPLKSGFQRGKPSPRVRELATELRDKMREAGIETTGEEQLASARKAVVNRLNNQIADLNAIIAGKGKRRSDQTPIEYDEEMNALLKERNELKEYVDDLTGPNAELKWNRRAQAAAKASEEYYKRRIATADFESRKLPGQTENADTRKAREEARKAKEEFNRLREATGIPQAEQLVSIKTRLEKEIEKVRQRLITGQKLASAGRTPPTDAEVQRLQQTLQNLRESVKLVEGTKEQTEEQRAAAAAKAVQKSIERLDQRIKNQDTTPAAKRTPADSEELRALREQKAFLQEQYDALKEAQNPRRLPEEIALSNFRRHIERKRQELVNGLKAEKYLELPAPDPLFQSRRDRARFELSKAREEWNTELLNAKLANRTPLKKVLGGIGEVLNVSRSILTSLDLSAVIRQGGFIGFGHPALVAKSLGPMFKAFYSKENEFKAMEEIRARKNFPLYSRAKLYLTDMDELDLSKMEENYMSRFATKIPLVAGSQRAYITFLNKLRADTFDLLIETLGRDGRVTEAEGKAIASFINVATGRGIIGSADKPQGTPVLSTIFFSPRLLASRFNLIGGQPLYGGTPRTRALVAQQYGRFLVGIGASLALLALFKDPDDDEPMLELDARSSDFLKARFGNTRIDLFGGLLQATVLMSRLVSGQTKKRGKIVDIRGPNKPYSGDSTVDVLAKFIRSKLSPAIGSAVNLAQGQDFAGEPVTPVGEAIKMTVPMSLTNIKDVMEDQGVPRGTAMTLLSLFGAGLQTYDGGSTILVDPPALEELARNWNATLPEKHEDRWTPGNLTGADYVAKAQDPRTKKVVEQKLDDPLQKKAFDAMLQSLRAQEFKAKIPEAQVQKPTAQAIKTVQSIRTDTKKQVQIAMGKPDWPNRVVEAIRRNDVQAAQRWQRKLHGVPVKTSAPESPPPSPTPSTAWSDNPMERLKAMQRANALR